MILTLIDGLVVQNFEKQLPLRVGQFTFVRP